MIEVKNVFSSEEITYESGNYSINARCEVPNGEFRSVSIANFCIGGKPVCLAGWFHCGFELSSDFESNAEIDAFVAEATAALVDHYGIELPEEGNAEELLPTPPTENEE